MVKRKICIVTGTRAEYGLLRFVLENLKNSDEVSLQIVATGMHLSPEFGLTVKSIEADGFPVTKRVESLLSSDTPTAIAKSTGLGIIGFADAFADLQPDLIVLLGDRFVTRFQWVQRFSRRFFCPWMGFVCSAVCYVCL